MNYGKASVSGDLVSLEVNSIQTQIFKPRSSVAQEQISRAI